MGKRFVYAFLILSAVSVQASKKDTSSNLPHTKDPMRAHMESREVFMRAMDNPMVAEVFRQDQLEKFTTPFDHEIRTFFSTNPLFGQVFGLIHKNYDLVLNEFSDSMLIGSTRLVRGLTTDYDRILKIVQETALDLGFAENAIKNIEVYVIGGTENAFTVSGLQDRIVIVFQRDILRTMSNGEIRAVVGHELGHIRAQHVITGQVNQMMLQLLAIYITKSAGEMTELELSEELAKSQEFIPEHYNADLKMKDMIRIMSHVEEKSHAGDSKTRGQSRHHKMNLQKRNFMAQVDQFMMGFLNQPQNVQRHFFVEYLSILIRNLEANGALSDSIEFFKSVREDLATKPYFRHVSEADAKFHFAIASFSVSQAFETSSDMISNSVVKREYLASAMAKLLGADFDGSRQKSGYDNRSERQRIIKQHLKQAAEFRARNQGDAAAQYLSLMTHPAPVIRVEQIMHLEKYPAIIFADPFMRVLYLKDLLSIQLINLEMQLGGLKVAIDQIAQAQKPVPKQLKQAMAQLSQAYMALEPEYGVLAEKVVDMLINETRGGITAPYKSYETIELNDFGFPEINVEYKSGAPRFYTYMRYLANYRKELVARMQVLSAQSQEAKDQELAFIKYNMQVLVGQFELSKKFVESVLISAQDKMSSMQLLPESRNLIANRVQYLEKIASLKSPQELLETLADVEAQAGIKNAKSIFTTSDADADSRLFSRNFTPIVLVTRSAQNTCAGFFN